MMDVEPIALSSMAKGKGRAVDHGHPLDNDNLPWQVPFFIHATTKCLNVWFRVEKYRPVTLDDVVSHKDIISTSKGDSYR